MSGNITMRFVDSSELNASIQKLALAAGSTVKEVLPSQMRLFAADLAFNTRPIGKTSAGQKEGHAKVESRIRTVYPSVGMMAEMCGKREERLKTTFIALVKRRKFPQAAKLLNDLFSGNYQVGQFDGGQLHKKQQFTRRVNDILVVTNYPKVNAYVREKKSLVGFAKGGFATAARQLGGVRGIPGFATRQKAPGTGSVTGTGNKLTVTMTNNVKHIEHALDKHGEARAISHRQKAVTAVIKRMMNRKTKSASRSLR